MFSIPKPNSPFNPKLQRLFEVVRKRFASKGVLPEWQEFYPIAKSFLAQNVTSSLISTYQNKYTLHRSIATAATLLFWASVIAIGVSNFTSYTPDQAPSYLLLSALAIGSLALVYGFSASYIYNWEMFGNTIVTETYSKLCGPQDDKSKR